MCKRAGAAAIVALALGAGASAAAGAAQLRVGALGDSISVGWATAGFDGPVPANAWVSIAARRLNLALADEAQPGATMAQLGLQVTLLPPNTRLVTVEMGTNDACYGTPAAAFGLEFESALKALARREPRARVVVLSVFDLPAMWDAVKTVHGAATRRTYCPEASMGGRATFESILAGLNRRLASVCSRHPSCRYDSGAAARIRWKRADISTVDFFHPSLAGQRKIAAALLATHLLAQ